MVSVKRMVLDVLKPHQPNALEFCLAIANAGADYRVCLNVMEMDERTETVRVEIVGDSLDFEAIRSTINGMGGSLHSIDEVEAHSEAHGD